jgi:hypothetical protein
MDIPKKERHGVLVTKGPSDNQINPDMREINTNSQAGPMPKRGGQLFL